MLPTGFAGSMLLPTCELEISLMFSVATNRSMEFNRIEEDPIGRGLGQNGDIRHKLEGRQIKYADLSLRMTCRGGLG